MKIRWVLEAIGAALLLLFPVLAPLLSPGYLFVYHHRLPLTHLINGLLLDICFLAAAGAAILALVPRLPGITRTVIGGGLAGFFLWSMAYGGYVLLNGWRFEGMTALPQPSVLSALAVWWHRWCFELAPAIPLLLAAINWLRPARTRHGIRAVRFALAMIAFLSLWIVPELLYLEIRAHAEDRGAASSPPVRAAAKGRIVWILFDELSYKLALSQPPQGEEFPNFQRLHSESISFGNIQPAGNFTDLVIPSVLAGRQISRIGSTPEGALLYMENGRQKWSAWDSSVTLFATARANGWNSGVVGWHLPYCRILADDLTRCFWEPGTLNNLPFESWASRDSAVSYASALPRAFLWQVYSRAQANDRRSRLIYQDDESLMTEAKALLDDQGVHFVFIHLPVPHPPGAYDRRTHQPCACGNYIDNLTLADDMLARLMRQIDETPGATGTTLIVSSDHSWRVPLWRSNPGWTEEEERISLGRFDPRPVFMIHFAGQNVSSDVLAPVAELLEYDIIRGMLESRIRRPEDVQDLLRAPNPIAAGAHLSQ